MPEETIPAIDTQDEDMTDEVVHYECAFHILPTVADEEVQSVVDGLQLLVTRSGGSVIGAEVSERYDLAYEIAKAVAGVNRRFNAAHFGWMRFTLAPSSLDAVIVEVKQKPEILRYLVIRLTREEAQKPFSILDASRAREQANDKSTIIEREARGEETGEVSEGLLDESLEKLTAE